MAPDGSCAPLTNCPVEDPKAGRYAISIVTRRAVYGVMFTLSSPDQLRTQLLWKVVESLSDHGASLID